MSNSGRSSSSVHSGELLVGRYQLERLIGKGGMAEVWSALDVDLDRRVAVKWLKPSLAGDPVIAERFRREALAVAKLSHPNIVAIHDVIEHEDRQAVVMQLVDGKSLRVHLDKQKRLGPELTIHIGASIASALDAAHGAKLVHRDVKPGNILLTSDGRVLLTDFGIAKALDGAEEDLTSDNVMMGTAKYLAPEQVRGKPLDGRADIYALGLVLYECLAGRVPFLGESDADTALARLQRDPTDLGHLRPTLPIGLVNLIHKTLARNPAHRPQSGLALRSALMAVDTKPPAIDHTPAELPPRQQNPPQRARGAGPGVPGEPQQPNHAPTSSPAGATGARRANGVRSNESSNRKSGGGDERRRAGRGTAVEPAGPPAKTSAAFRVTPFTPPTGSPVASRPISVAARRGAQQRLGPTRAALLVIALVALVVMIILVMQNKAGTPAPDLPTNTASAATTPAGSDNTGPAAIATIAAYDPEGDNNSENDSQAPLALSDDDPDNFWASECYQNEYLNGKSGVGLVVTLTNSGKGELTFNAMSAPYEVQVLLAPGDRIPDSIEQWRPASGTFTGTQPDTVRTKIESSTRHILVWLTKLGEDPKCTSTNQYRGKIGDLSFKSSG